jgi:hypothetical protein
LRPLPSSPLEYHALLTLSKGELEITLPKKEIGRKITVEQKAA